MKRYRYLPSMVDAATSPEQFELIKDDPRQEAEIGPLQLLREFRAAQKEHGNLISRPLAAAILGVSVAQVGTWCGRGRLSTIEIGPTKFVPGNEIEALYRERVENDLPVGGRGKRLPSMSDVIREGSKITE